MIFTNEHLEHFSGVGFESTLMLDSNPSEHFIKTRIVQAKMKKVIRIPQGRIQIPFSENSDWWRWFEFQFQNVQTKEFEDRDSNLDFSKVCSNGWIRISIQEIQIPSEERSETKGHRFESLKFGFESLMKNKWRDWSWIQITYTTIRIPGFRVMKNKSKRFESSSYGFESYIQKWSWRSDRRIRIFELWIRIPLWRKIQILQKRFESLTQWFESLFL